MQAIAFAALLAGLLAAHSGAPWQYANDDNGAWFSAMAQTHVRCGLGATRGQDFFLSRATDERVPYLHHPPLPGLILAAVFWGTGQDTPRLARLTFAALHLLTFFLVAHLAAWRAVRAGFSSTAYVAALAVTATVPMSAFYGKMPNHEVPGLLFFLGGVVCWGATDDAAPSRGRLLAAWGCWLPAVFASWHATFCIAGWLVVQARPGRWRPVLQSAAVVVAILGAVVLHLFWAADWQVLASQGQSLTRWRLGGGSPIASALQAYRHALGIGISRYAYLPALLAGAWLVATVWRTVGRGRDTVAAVPDRTLVGLLVGSLLYFVCFPEAVGHHAYQGFYLIPFVALATGDVLGRLGACCGPRPWARAIVLPGLVIAICLAGILTTLRMYRKPSQAAVTATAALETAYY